MTQRMSNKLNRFHILAFMASCSLMALSILGIFAGDWFASEYEPKVMVRNITQAFTPPPPPPKPISQPTKQNQPTIELNAAGKGPAIDLTKLTIKQPPNPMISPPDFYHAPSDLNLDLAIDWQAFGLGELDTMPVLLTKVKTTFPRSLARKGIKQVIVALDVFIDEQGNITLINIKEMPYKALLNSIHKLIRKSRFSVPTKNGQPVRARFVWPVEFKK